jgi:hypothetical protein
MPKTDIDYSNTIIYKITCNDESISDLYVGHTTNFVQRKHAHKISCTNIKSPNYNCRLYNVIRNNGGWDNWKMEIINFFNCKDHYEARKKEQEYFMLLNATLNSIEPLPTPKYKEVTPEEVTPEEVTPKYEEKKEKNEKNEKKIIYCYVCDVKFNTEKLLEEHNGTKKHKNKINNQMVEKNAEKCQIFTCKICDFKCYKESNYKKHFETIKHKMLTNGNKKMPDEVDEIFSCICGNTYKYRPGLTRHKKVCAMVTGELHQTNNNNNNNNNKNDTIYGNDGKQDLDKSDGMNNILCSDNKIMITSEMFMALIKNSEEMMKVIKEQQEQIKEQQEQIITIIPKIGNTTNNTTNNNNNTTNNNFNLNVFLNEKCKDALNMSDFIDSLKITLEDLLFSKTNGITRGITDVMIKRLKELDIYRRPIHCTDIKRDIMYIKDEDTWQKDQNHDMIKNTIVKIADKERTALQQWAIDNPDWIETEKKQIEYLTMMRSICEPIENYNNYERKIIKNIGKEIQIDKKFNISE